MHYFTYGTLQAGYPNHAAFAEQLGPCLGRFRTVEPYPLVVPERLACPNPGCRFEHRICALLDAAGEGAQVEGEVYQISAAALVRLDALEDYRVDDEPGSAYLRRAIEVRPADGGPPLRCVVYVIAQPGPYRALLARGEAALISRYTLEMAQGQLKGCCVRSPGH